jgi:hypothetical protein
MMNTLINALDRQLKWCGDEMLTTFRKTYFDQAFGMAQMACCFYPNDAERIQNLWEDVYRPAFEKLVYEGVNADDLL